MANSEHVDILRQGVEVWNRWREKYPEVKPDLRDASLSHADLHFANFWHANLQNADLTETYLDNTNLIDADLHFANLFHAQLSHAVLINANLSHANLGNTKFLLANFKRANLTDACLHSANFSYADFSYADLTNADLRNVDFTNAKFGDTALGDRDLRVIKGLDTINHKGPSPLSINTIYLSGGDIPEIFMRGTGAPDIFIEYMRSLVGKPIEFYSCFISYSSKDQAFAERLYADLQSKNVRCWFAPEDLKIGDKFRVRIDESIRLYDKLLLVLSEHSLASN